MVRKWINDSFDAENKIPGNINVIFCNDDYLQKMNFQYLKHETLTDIITFDYSDLVSISGDLFISIDRVKDNAKLFNKTLTEELHRVIIHGILHLCGYNDKTKKEKIVMTEKENFYLGRRPDELQKSS